MNPRAELMGYNREVEKARDLPREKQMKGWILTQGRELVSYRKGRRVSATIDGVGTAKGSNEGVGELLLQDVQVKKNAEQPTFLKLRISVRKKKGNPG